jgi:hypothetical protein
MGIVEQEIFLYKGYPLVRNGSCIYYGYMSDPSVVMMRVKHQSQHSGIPVADQIQIYQLSTDENRSVRTAKRPSLYAALDLAAAWLHRAEQESDNNPVTTA